MAAFASVTSRIKVGSGVIPIWTRNVGLLAATFATLDDLAPGRVIPVSYTHLRAHETVLDIVCRLLLENTNRK